MQVFDLDSIRAKHPRHATADVSIRKSKAWLYLSETDRTLLEMVEKGLPHRLIGQALGLNAGTISRRLGLCTTEPSCTTERVAAQRKIDIQVNPL